MAGLVPRPASRAPYLRSDPPAAAASKRRGALTRAHRSSAAAITGAEPGDPDVRRRTRPRGYRPADQCDPGRSEGEAPLSPMAELQGLHPGWQAERGAYVRAHRRRRVTRHGALIRAHPIVRRGDQSRDSEAGQSFRRAPRPPRSAAATSAPSSRRNVPAVLDRPHSILVNAGGEAQRLQRSRVAGRGVSASEH